MVYETVYFCIDGAKFMKSLTVKPLVVFCSIQGVNGLSNLLSVYEIFNGAAVNGLL